jgi:hypothetical protein
MNSSGVDNRRKRNGEDGPNLAIAGLEPASVLGDDAIAQK